MPRHERILPASTLPPVAAQTRQYCGCQLTYWMQGSGPPVILIQGVAVHGAAWRPQVDALAGQYHCLWFDNRGLGQSQPMGTTVSVAQMADDVAQLMDAAGWQSAHIVGHSLGGPVALELAFQARARVRSLALLCTFATGRNAGPLTPRMLWVGTRTQIGSRRQRRRAFLELVLPPALLAGTDRDVLATQLGRCSGVISVSLQRFKAPRWRRCAPTMRTRGLANWLGFPPWW